MAFSLPFQFISWHFLRVYLKFLICYRTPMEISSTCFFGLSSVMSNLYLLYPCTCHNWNTLLYFTLTLCTTPWYQFSSNYFYFSVGKFFCKMYWVLSKRTFYIATKFCSKSYQSNSFTIKTLNTPSGHHSLASCTIL